MAGRREDYKRDEDDEDADEEMDESV